MIIIGLDNAGKTTILYKLHLGEIVTTVPTVGFNVESMNYNGLKFQVWDLGGQTGLRPYWRCYYQDTNAVVFVVDSADRERIEYSRQELDIMLHAGGMDDQTPADFAAMHGEENRLLSAIGLGQIFGAIQP